MIRLGGRTRSFGVTFMDCDGVFFDSNQAKVRAFAGALAEYPEGTVQELIALHRDQGGVSRYEKLKRFFAEMYPVEDPDSRIEVALEKFSAIAKAEYRNLTVREEALEMATRMGGPDRVVVVSGSDQEELRQVFREHGIDRAVSEILGSPTRKQDHVGRVLAERGVRGEDALMVGDGRADFESAQAYGMPFIFLEEMSEWARAHDVIRGAKDVHVVKTWRALLERLVTA